MLRARPQETVLCEVCQGEFPSGYLLQLHKVCHFNSSTTCYVCDKVVPGFDAMGQHVTSLHPLLFPFHLRNAGKKDIVYCEVCLQCFCSKQGLLIHQEVHSKEEGEYDCKLCCSVFPNARELQLHLTRPPHQDMKMRVQNGFVCVECRSIFASRDNYAMHMMVRAQNDQCPNKDQKVPQQKELPQGVATATVSPRQNTTPSSPSDHCHQTLNISPQTDPGDSLMCVVCQKHFTTRDSLAMHMMLHCQEEGTEGGARCSSAPAVNLSNGVQFNNPSPTSAKIPALICTANYVSDRKTPDPMNLTVGGTADEDTSSSVKNAVTPTQEEINLPGITRRKRKSTYLYAHNLLGNGPQGYINTFDLKNSSNSVSPAESTKDDATISPMGQPIKIKQEPVDHDTATPTFACQSSQASQSQKPLAVVASNGGSCIPQPANMFSLEENATLPGLQTLAPRPSPSASRDPNTSTTFEVLQFLHQNLHNLHMCKYCKIVFAEKTLYRLHMGLHNLNNPWQCNLCGKMCGDLVGFTIHVIHYE